MHLMQVLHRTLRALQMVVPFGVCGFFWFVLRFDVHTVRLSVQGNCHEQFSGAQGPSIWDIVDVS